MQAAKPRIGKIVAGWWAAAFLLGLAGVAAAQDARGFRGRWNGWNYEAMEEGRGVWRATVQAVEAQDGDFKIAEADWAYEWTHGGEIPTGTVVAAYPGGENSWVAWTTGRYYTIAMDDAAAGTEGRMIVQETEGEPTAIGSVSHETAAGTATVAIATATAPWAGERIFARYSLDGWATSGFAEATGEGTNWTARIAHGAGDGGRTCAYYAVTTTVGEPAHEEADLQALRWDDNGGTGYWYVVEGGGPEEGDVRINEVLASNVGGAVDEDGDHSDWIELHNVGGAAVSLQGWGLSDSYSNPFKWTFGEATIGPGEFLVVWASSKNRPAVTNGNQLHTSFAVSSGGEEVVLTKPDGTRADEREPIALAADESIGRQPDGTGPWKLFATPTPGAPNYGEGVEPGLPAPTFSVPGGIYTGAVQVALATEVAGGEIRYTLDGSEPTTNSTLYEGPIALDSREGATNRLSEIPTNNDPNPGPPYYEGWQPPAGDVFQFNVLRARTFRDGAAPSAAATQSYLVDPAGTNRYGLPIVSIATDEKNLFDPEIGIYVPGNHDNMYQSGSEWERPGTIEFYEEDGSLGFAGGVGIRLHGNTTRSRPRKALRIYARDPSAFSYRLFPDKELATFETFILRNGGNDWGQGVVRDLYLQSMAANGRMERQHGRPVLVFLNGEYWGIHDLRERYDEGYAQHNHGLGESEFTQMEIDRTTPTPNVPVYDCGNPEGTQSYYDLRNFLESSGVVSDENYAAAKDRLDVDSYVDFFQANVYFGNTDWPGNNMRLWRSTATNREAGAPAGHDGRWRFMLYDADFGFGLNFHYVPGNENYFDKRFGEFAQHDTLAYATSATETDFSNHPDATMVIRRLLENEDFRKAFVARFSDQLNTAYGRAHATGEWARWTALLDPEMAEHAARWRQPSDWNAEKARIRSFAEQREEAVWGHLRNKFGLGERHALTVDATNAAAGVVRVNTIELDEGTAGFAGYPWTGEYFGDYAVELEAKPREGYRFVEWRKDGEAAANGTNRTLEATLTGSARFEAVFAAAGPERALVHYWNFNDTNALMVASYSRAAGAAMAVVPGSNTTATSGTGQDFAAANARFGDPAGAHLRMNEPIGARLDVALPTTGHEDALVKYETRRSGSGAGAQTVSYTLDGTAYTELATVEVGEVPEVKTFDFTDVAGADDNAAFGLRVEFSQGGGGTAGNNRFDNWTMEGVALGVTNLPPEVAAPIGFQSLVQGGAAATHNLAETFVDPENAPLTYGAESSDPETVSAEAVGTILTVVALKAGEATVYATADDGENPPTTNAFRVLAYPAAHALAGGEYAFLEWASTNAAGAYPANMLFVQGDQNDSTLGTALEYAYRIPPGDAAVPEDAERPYAASSRTRINGLGTNGIAFINTGRGRDLGGALLALDTRGATNATVEWRGGTVLTNARVYAIRLQYRAGTTGEFRDVVGGDGQAVEYVRAEQAGHERAMGPTALPADALGQEYVQLLWRYHWVSGESGPRAQLRLDDVGVAIGSEAPTGFAAWRQGEFDEAELADPETSGPLADPEGTGLPNLLRYALGLGRRDAPGDALPAGEADVANDRLVFRHRRLIGAAGGVEYVVETSGGIEAGAWGPAGIGTDLEEIGAEPTGDGATETMRYEVPRETLENPRFFRLKVRLGE